MLKILSIQQIRAADAYTIEQEPISSADLMERAATAIFQRMLPKISPDNKLIVFAGMGNNGGDGLVLARLFHQQSIETEVFILKTSEKGSTDFELNIKRLLQLGFTINYLTSTSQFPEIGPNDLVVDALFGSGLNKNITGFAAELIQHINNSTAVVVAVDMPSGLFADQPIDTKQSTVIKADYTYTFQWPKLSLLFPENEYFVGHWEVVPIGLHPDYETQVKTDYQLLQLSVIKRMLKPRSRFSHKGNFGHALLIAGSRDKTGAAILAAQACLRSGAGLLHVHLPQKAVLSMQCSLPEAMISTDSHPDFFSELPDIAAYTSIAIGPGLGTSEKTATTLKLLIQQSRFPLILDADALNILSENKTWLPFLPKNSILTPHPGEFKRLAGSWRNSFERVEMQRQFSIRFRVFVIVKGAFTCITTPTGNCVFNPNGNPGMATAGSGDVLTGMLLGLTAKGFEPYDAALLGVYLHGLAGDKAAAKTGEESLIASDIIHAIGDAFKSVQN